MHGQDGRSCQARKLANIWENMLSSMGILSHRIPAAGTWTKRDVQTRLARVVNYDTAHYNAKDWSCVLLVNAWWNKSLLKSTMHTQMTAIGIKALNAETDKTIFDRLSDSHSRDVPNGNGNQTKDPLVCYDARNKQFPMFRVHASRATFVLTWFVHNICFFTILFPRATQGRWLLNRNVVRMYRVEYYEMLDRGWQLTLSLKKLSL